MPTVVSRVDKVTKGLEQEIVTRLTHAGAIYTGEVKRLMIDSPASGRLYRRRRKGQAGRRKGGKGFITHRASAPGEPPAVDRGILVKSIGFQVLRRARTIILRAGSSLPKLPIWLEFGTRKMAPRPAWRPALQNVKGKLNLGIK